MIELRDKCKYVVFWNDHFPVSNDFSFGRCKLLKNFIELLEKDKVVVTWNELLYVLNDLSLGRYHL